MDEMPVADEMDVAVLLRPAIVVDETSVVVELLAPKMNRSVRRKTQPQEGQSERHQKVVAVGRVLKHCEHQGNVVD